MNICLLYGTETGNSEMLCEDMQSDVLGDHSCSIQNLGEVDPAALDRTAFHIFVTSTYGNGDLPTQAVAFEEAMSAQKPDLNGLRFAIFGLGDQVFSETFNHGSKRLCEMLLAAGATKIGERGLHDASSFEMPEDVAIPWLEKIMEQALESAA